jgi:lipoate-protein ligase A
MASTITKNLARTGKSAIRLSWLDLRATGLSMLERLSIEEALLRHDDRNWAIVGTHDPYPHRYLNNKHVELPSYIDEHPNPDCLVVMGIGGKPEKMLNIPKVKEDQVMVCKRFSGGGTVVLDASSLWTTFIGRTDDFTHVEPYPKSIMQWSADEVFGPTFDHMSKHHAAAATTTPRNASKTKKTLVLDTNSCSNTDQVVRILDTSTTPSSSTATVTSTELPRFSLRENDYVFGERKMGGNAQSIVKGGWLHHTSFLWDYVPAHMEYLRLPDKRPDYRGDRPHEEFLVTLQPYFGTTTSTSSSSKGVFFTSMLQACQESFEVEKVTLSEAMEQVIDGKLGGMEAWWEKNRTRIVHDF